jgi:hypothetical protein
MMSASEANEKPGSAPPLTGDDRLAIHELVSLHGHLVDACEFARLDELFTDDAVLDVEDFGLGTHRGLKRIRELVVDFSASDRNPLAHHTTNPLVSQDEAGAVRVLSKGLGVLADGRTGSAVYRDRVVKTPRGWRIAHRVITAQRAGRQPARPDHPGS